MLNFCLGRKVRLFIAHWWVSLKLLGVPMAIFHSDLKSTDIFSRFRWSCLTSRLVDGYRRALNSAMRS